MMIISQVKLVESCASEYLSKSHKVIYGMLTVPYYLIENCVKYGTNKNNIEDIRMLQ